MSDERLIAGGTLVAMDPQRRVMAGEVLCRGRDIVWIGPPGRAPRTARGVSRERIDARGALVLPGFVQAHVHLCQALFRGLADDLPLMRWLRERIWPLEAGHDPRSLRASARLGVAELLLGGTTTILDMGTVRHHGVVLETMQELGIRGFSGKAMMDQVAGAPRGLRETTAQSLRESDELCRLYHDAQGRVRYAYAPRFILSCSSRLLGSLAERMSEPGVLIHSHVAEHVEERREVQAALGMPDLAAFAALGLAGPRLVLAHGVQLTAREIQAAARAGTRLVHCPSANLKLASGIADVVRMRAAGVVVGLGADGAPCNNRLDVLWELRLAALLAKVKRADAAALSAQQALELATIDGARVLGLEGEVGSLEVGKRADIVVVDVSKVGQAPALDPVSTLVYASSAADVRHVLVDGVPRVRSGTLLGASADAIRREAQAQARCVVARTIE